MSRFPFRRLLRAVHRDIGYFGIGLTVIYAASGLAVNHIKDWDPNFTQESRRVLIPKDEWLKSSGPYGAPKFASTIGELTLQRLELDGPVDDAFALDSLHVDVIVGKTTVHVDLERGSATLEGQKARFFLRLANWLHLNRGKPAWSFIADTYAAALLLLAASGFFMLPQKKRLWNRRTLFTGLGVAVPVAYVVLSGGP